MGAAAFRQPADDGHQLSGGKGNQATGTGNGRPGMQPSQAEGTAATASAALAGFDAADAWPVPAYKLLRQGGRPLRRLLRGERHPNRHRRLLRSETAQPRGPAEPFAARHGGILLGQGESLRRPAGRPFLRLLPGKMPADPRLSALRPGGAPCATPPLI